MCMVSVFEEDVSVTLVTTETIVIHLPLFSKIKCAMDTLLY